jgi:hypothetical protein
LVVVLYWLGCSVALLDRVGLYLPHESEEGGGQTDGAVALLGTAEL